MSTINTYIIINNTLNCRLDLATIYYINQMLFNGSTTLCIVMEFKLYMVLDTFSQLT